VKEQSETAKPKKENGWANLVINILIPTVIMIKFSKPEYLGQFYGLIIALAFPVIYGIYDLLTSSKVNAFSIIGLISILITGGIGLLELDRTWMIVKETGIPAIMALAIFISQHTKYPLVKAFLNQIVDLERVREAYVEQGKEDFFNTLLKNSAYLLSLTFTVSAVLNFFLAIYILKGQPGSSEFVESLGKMTFLSFPVITLPMMFMVGFVLNYLYKNVKSETTLNLDDIIRT
jgi:intracellular septation protein A